MSIRNQESGPAEHWERIYQTKRDEELSWFEASPTISLAMLDAAGMTRESCVLDVGGGSSRLIDALLARGMRCLAVLDVSGAALQRAQSRLGDAATIPAWIEADVTGDWSLEPMDIWHDRGVFHFLVSAEDRRRYVTHLKTVVKPGGTAIIATFAPGGPEQCSGLQVTRYSEESLAETLGGGFEQKESRRHEHRTPSGAGQAFLYLRFSRSR